MVEKARNFGYSLSVLITKEVIFWEEREVSIRKKSKLAKKAEEKSHVKQPKVAVSSILKLD